ncbi:MAG TPA: MaoC family dehydratase [Steroidobacteraceae bacterium]|nr:MaoC family dehydratase [Steroidobacteraceae bacterium]
MTESTRPTDAILLARGHRYEDFTPGRVFDHAQRKTILESENALFTTLTLHYNPLYLDRVRAMQSGHRDIVVNPLLVFNLVFGLTVEDLSEGGGPFLGIDELEYGVAVYPGDTLQARSTVISARLSAKHEHYGIVMWETVGLQQDGARVVKYRRSNLVRRG